MDDSIKEKKVNRRNKAKHPALQRKYNLKMRQDYIETEYINGVFDKDGNQVIRSLNCDEKDFLNKYYEEAVGANFLYDSELKSINQELRKLKSKRDLSKGELLELDKLQLEYYARADEVLLYPEHADQKKLYGENNTRNRCLFNRTKAVGILDELNDNVWDEIHEQLYSDPRTGENIMINKVEKKLKNVLRKKKDGKTKPSQKPLK